MKNLADRFLDHMLDRASLSPGEVRNLWKEVASYADRIGREKYGKEAWERMTKEFEKRTR